MALKSEITKMEGDDTGTKLTCRFGKDLSTEPAASNTGTQIFVKNLFQNIYFPNYFAFLVNQS